jgi:hypothetical protein
MATAFSNRTERVLADAIGRVFEDGARAERAGCLEIIEAWRNSLSSAVRLGCGNEEAVWLCDQLIAAIRARAKQKTEAPEPVPEVPCTC